MRRRIHVLATAPTTTRRTATMRRRIHVSYEEEDTCVSNSTYHHKENSHKDTTP
jgi:hypothetical protein